MVGKGNSLGYQSAAEVLKDLNSQRKVVAHIPSNQSSVNTKTQPTQPWRCIDTITLHERRVNAIAFSSDGQILASGGADQTIKLWFLNTGEILTLKGHRDSIRAIAFSPDSQLLISGSNDCTIKIWRQPFTNTTLTPSGTVSAIAFSPDGKLLASGSVGKTIKIWQLNTGEKLLTPKMHSAVVTSLKGHLDRINSLAFSRDGKILASGSDDKTINIWQLDTGKIIC